MNNLKEMDMKKLLKSIACVLFCISSIYAQNKESMLNLKERQIAAISGSAAKGDKPGLFLLPLW